MWLIGAIARSRFQKKLKNRTAILGIGAIYLLSNLLPQVVISRFAITLFFSKMNQTKVCYKIRFISLGVNTGLEVGAVGNYIFTVV